MVRVIPESVLSYGELSLLLVQLTISEESMTTCLLALRSTRLTKPKVKIKKSIRAVLVKELGYRYAFFLLRVFYPILVFKKR